MINNAVDPVKAAAIPATPAAAHDNDDSDKLEFDLIPVNACSRAQALTDSSPEPEPGFITGQVDDDDDDDDDDDNDDEDNDNDVEEADADDD